MYKKSSRDYPKNKKKSGPHQTWRLQKMLMITHVSGAKQGTRKNKKALVSEKVSLRTKSKLLEILVTNRLPKKFLGFS